MYLKGWQFLKFRPDKSEPNSLNVAERVFETIKEDIKQDYLIGYSN